jgi:hypothetical protein
MLNAVMLSVIRLNVVMLSVVVQAFQFITSICKKFYNIWPWLALREINRCQIQSELYFTFCFITFILKQRMFWIFEQTDSNIWRTILNTLKVQWVETNPSSICFFPKDIRFYLASWYYANGLWMSVYRCSQMLDWLVSFHPSK